MTSVTPLRAYSGVRAVVLGASGFVGRWVAHSLSESGADLHAVVRSPADAERVFSAYGIDADLHAADLKDLEGTRLLLLRLAPTIVFNCAGYGVDPGERSEADERIATTLNSELPALAAETLATTPSAGWRGRRIVHAGTVLEYGNIGGHLEETSAAAPFEFYGRTKLAGTLRLSAACLSTDTEGVTARLFQVYGPGEHKGRLLPTLIEGRHHSAPLSQSVGTQRKDFTYVGDVAEGLLRLGLTAGPPGEIVNLATGRLATVREFVETAAHLLRLDPSRLKFEKPIPDNELRHLEVAIGRLRKLTCWEPAIDVAEGIRRTLHFLDRTGNG